MSVGRRLERVEQDVSVDPQHERLHLGGDRGVARRVVEQPALAEAVAGPEVDPTTPSWCTTTRPLTTAYKASAGSPWTTTSVPGDGAQLRGRGELLEDELRDALR